MNTTKRANRKRLFFAFLLIEAIMVFLVSGCLTSGPIWVNILGNQKMNVDDEKTNESHAVLVCLYMLRHNQNFLLVPLEDFWQGGEKAFESDLVERKEIVLIPNAPEWPWVDLQFSKETRYFGVAADFRNPDRKEWRQIHDLAAKKPKQIWLTVGKNKIEIEKIK